MTRFTKFLGSTAALLALAACGGGGGGGGSSTTLFANDVGSVAKALDDGRVITAAHASTLARDYETGATTRVAVPFTLSKSEDGHLVMTVNGNEVVFTEADIDGEFSYTDDTPPGFLNLASGDGPLADDLDPENTSYASIFRFYYDDDGEGAQFGTVVIGTETELADLQALEGELTYSGFMFVAFHQQEDFFLFRDDTVRVRGDMQLVADFDDGMISGNSIAEGLEFQNGAEPEYSAIDGQIFYSASMIEGTSFGGGVTADAAFYDNEVETEVTLGDVLGLFDVDYEGSFFGPEGQEAAGVLTGSTDGGYNVVGQFNAEYFD